jgi:hypothetical protein
MKEQIASIETQIALMKNDITALKSQESNLPMWVKRVAIATLFTVFSQTISVVWWASSISTNVEHIAKEVSENTAFRLDWPSKHEEVMIKLSRIEVQSEVMNERLRDVLSDHKNITN